MIASGRKQVFVRFTIYSIFSCAIMQILWVPTLIFGKFMHGVTVTVVHMACQKMIVETVPKHKSSIAAPIFQTFA